MSNPKTLTRSSTARSERNAGQANTQHLACRSDATSTRDDAPLAKARTLRRPRLREPVEGSILAPAGASLQTPGARSTPRGQAVWAVRAALGRAPVAGGTRHVQGEKRANCRIGGAARA